VNNEPFAILLGDTLIESDKGSVTKQLMKIYDKHHGSVVALEEVDSSLTHRYGVIAGKETGTHTYKVERFIEKPAPGKAPSNLAIASRYIFTPEIFTYLEQVKPGINGEVQLTDAMQLMVQEHAMFGLKFLGKRYDIGNKLDFLKTNVIYGLKREDLGREFRIWLEVFLGKESHK
jgi:UTP--glucose-1-phosphate uridylyltransferase